jgi:hypothetical protein
MRTLVLRIGFEVLLRTTYYSSWNRWGDEGRHVSMVSSSRRRADEILVHGSGGWGIVRGMRWSGDEEAAQTCTGE